MRTESERAGRSTITPEEAFSLLGNETRMEILQVLGAAGYGESLTFEQLRDRVDIRDSGQFNYHLGKLLDHFVEKTDNGYVLLPNGHRVVEAVFAETMTGAAELPSSMVRHPCPWCSADTEVEFLEQRLYRYCPSCPGTYGHTALPGVSVDPEERGYLGFLNFPPAGSVDRDPEEAVAAATIWHHLRFLNPANGMCPRCGAPSTARVEPCLAHGSSEEICESCGYRHALRIDHRCSNCTFYVTSGFADWLLTNLDFVAFLVRHDINPISPTPEDIEVWVDYDAEILEEDPFRARLTFTIGEDGLSLTINDELEVIDATERSDSRTK